MIGKTLSHYKIVEKLGEGGMGVVYKAEDTKLKREVAIKFLPRQIAASDEERERFKIEAQAAAALNHPNIATIHAIEDADDETFIVMEYIKGQELKDKIQTAPVPIDQAIMLAIQVARGLQAAHEEGVIHRDIKSANIMLTHRGDVKVMDFGLAKLGGQTKITKAGTTLGTAAYMSPEQTRGEPVDQRSDLFSLGVLIYEMLTGQYPFKGDYDQAVTYAILNEEPDPVTGLRSGIPMELERIVNKCLKKDPAARYQHADELIADLSELKKESETREILSQSKIKAAPDPAAPKKNKVLVPAAISVGLVLLLAVFYLGGWLGQKDDSPAAGGSSGGDVPKVAVLYLENIGGQSEGDLFVAGMTEDIITELSNISSLQVISKYDVQPYRSKEVNIASVGKELGVNYVMGGSIRRALDQLRVNVQLIRVEDGVQVWSDRFDRQLQDVFQVQGEIATSIAGALDVTLSPQEKERVGKIPTANISAYDLYLKGREHRLARSRSDNLEAEKYFRQAIDLDRRYALAYVGMAEVFLQRIDWGYDPDPKWLEEARIMLDQASALDTTQAELHLAFTNYYRIARNREKSIESAAKAVAIRPNDAETYYYLALPHFSLRNWNEAENALKEALRLRPNYPEPYRWLARIARAKGQPDEAVRYAEKGVELAPDAAQMWSRAGWENLWSGHFTKAESHFRQAIDLKPGTYEFGLGWTLLIQDKLESAIPLLEKIGRGGGTHVALGHAFRLKGDRLRADQAYREALRIVEDRSDIWGRYVALYVRCVLGQVADPTDLLAELAALPYNPERPSDRAWQVGAIHAAVGNIEQAIAAIEEILSFNTESPKYIAADLAFSSLKDNPRFVELLQRPWPVKK